MNSRLYARRLRNNKSRSHNSRSRLHNNRSTSKHSSSAWRERQVLRTLPMLHCTRRRPQLQPTQYRKRKNRRSHHFLSASVEQTSLRAVSWILKTFSAARIPQTLLAPTTARSHSATRYRGIGPSFAPPASTRGIT